MEKSGFFNAMKVGDIWDRVYKSDNFAEYFATFIGNGVFPNPAKQLQVIETDNMNVIVNRGKAWINGFIYINTDELILPIDVADGVLDRIDKIVLRYSVSERDIRAVVKKGGFSSAPIAPQITRDADMYELAIADIYIKAGAISITQANITDLRLNKSLCGIVHGTVDQVDTTAIFNQFQSWYSQTKSNYNNDISKWTTEKKEAFDKWYTENTVLFMQQFNKWYGDNTTKWTSEFNTWFDSIKGALDGDIAANLANRTIQLEKSMESVNEQLSETTKEIDNLKSSVGSGKDSLYSAIIGKKITPRSKDFNDLKSAIDNIKLGQGNAKTSEVLSGRTFTNDSGIMQNGTMSNMGSKTFTPTKSTQTSGSGYYSGVTVNPIPNNYYSIGSKVPFSEVELVNEKIWQYKGYHKFNSTRLSKSNDLYFLTDDKEIYKLDNKGDCKYIYGTDEKGNADKIDIDKFGNVFVNFYSSEKNCIRKINNEGKVLWEYMLDVKETFRDLITDEEGNVYFAKHDKYREYLLKINKDGKCEWTRELGYMGATTKMFINNYAVYCGGGILIKIYKTGKGDKNFDIGKTDSVEAICTDEEDSVYALCRYRENTYNFNYILRKFNKDAEDIWRRDTDYINELKVKGKYLYIIGNSVTRINKKDNNNEINITCSPTFTVSDNLDNFYRLTDYNKGILNFLPIFKIV